MKTIKRTKEMPINAFWLAINSHGHAYTSRLIDEPILHRDLGLGCSNDWQSYPLKDGYCKNWEKSLRKIVDKPSKKDKLIENQQKEIDSLLNIIDDIKKLIS